MKHPKRLTLKEKQLLYGQGYDPNNYLRIKSLADKIQVINIETEQIIEVWR
ncbi:hypothetical protein [Clostridium sp. KNHs214]|uniref:DUF6906 family protein n=1 Tax=Clostridium sp. KNHs214 TaxID=1540257 RepID=UPI000A9D95F5|nr:hypothetical protein [Clostridium sp. KNHs214]